MQFSGSNTFAAILLVFAVSTVNVGVSVKLCDAVNDEGSCVSYNDMLFIDKDLPNSDRERAHCRFEIVGDKGRMVDMLGKRFNGVQSYEVENGCCDFFADLWCRERRFDVCGDLANKIYNPDTQFGKAGYVGSIKAIKCF